VGNLSYNLNCKKGLREMRWGPGQLKNEMGPWPVKKSPHSESHVSIRIDFIYVFVIYLNSFPNGMAGSYC
jgi:hypothetical protein